MARTLVGWNDFNSGDIQWVDFANAPLWLRILARTTYLERYAYPIAARRGLVFRWNKNGTPADTAGIIYLDAPLAEMFQPESKTFALQKIGKSK